MFVVIISFPSIKSGKDAAFKEWFATSNEQFSTFEGFIGRRLLKPMAEGNYAAIVEFENREAFLAALPMTWRASRSCRCLTANQLPIFMRLSLDKSIRTHHNT